MKIQYTFINHIRNVINEWQKTLCRRWFHVKDILLFTSFPDFSDNALALTEYLAQHRNDHPYTIYWLVDHADDYRRQYGHMGITFLSKKNKLGMIPFRTMKIHFQARYVFATHSFLIPKEEVHPEQHYILLWHGCGFKTKLGDHYTLFDKGLVPGPLFIGSKSTYWNVTAEKILAEGYPRYDWMLNPSPKAREYFQVLKGNYDKVVFWLPTVRNSIFGREYPEGVINQFPILANDEDWSTVNAYLKTINMLLVVKLHNSQKQYSIPFEKYSNIVIKSNQDFDDAGVKMYELFPLTDALITDYSSVSFDYLVVDKPIAYTLDDFKLYESTRGFIFPNPLDYMPGHHVYDKKQLVQFLSDINDGTDAYSQRRAEVRKIAIAPPDESYCASILKTLDVIEK